MLGFAGMMPAKPSMLTPARMPGYLGVGAQGTKFQSPGMLTLAWESQLKSWLSQEQKNQYQYPGILAGVSMLQSPEISVGGLGMTGFFVPFRRGIGTWEKGKLSFPLATYPLPNPPLLLGVRKPETKSLASKSRGVDT
jgi:hypothetical protein